MGRTRSRKRSGRKDEVKEKTLSVEEEKLQENLEFTDRKIKEVTENELLVQLKVKLPNCCCICFSQFNQDCQEFDQLDLVCQRHQSVSAIKNQLLEDLDYMVYYGAMNLITAPNGVKRVCLDCWVSSIESSEIKFTKKICGYELFFNCPICLSLKSERPLNMDRLVASFPDEYRKQLAERIDQKLIELSYPALYCPVTGCRESRRYTNYDERKEVEAFNCPTHGKFCTSCHQKLDSQGIHLCSKLPKELLDWGKVDRLKDCPYCGTTIRKGPGCSNMTCATCHRSFDWHHDTKYLVQGSEASRRRRRHRVY